MIQDIEHPDGVWHTTYHEYKGRKLILKSRQGRGIKIHICFPNSDKVQKTFRYIFAPPDYLIQKAKFIDKQKLT